MYSVREYSSPLGGGSSFRLAPALVIIILIVIINLLFSGYIKSLCY